ncbi:MAG: ACP S-malonyltransferase [Oscillospiraceae bacterium]
MGKIAFLFAGQGAQQPGMGKALCGTAAGAEVFNALEAIRPGTMADCFEGSPERLAETDVTQPCVFAVDMAAAAALAAEGVRADGVAGFSLGEVAALGFAGAFSLEDAFRLVCQRSVLMRRATDEEAGAMAAVLRLPNEVVEALCQKFERLYPVNYNCDGQLVVAGRAEEIPAFCAEVKTAGGTARPLAVGGAFHSPLMAGAATAFSQILEAAPFETPALPVYANLTAAPYAPPLRRTLAAQMENPVRWSDTIKRMAADGYDTFVEVGPGKTLTTLAKRIVPTARLANVQDTDSLKAALELLAAG